MGEGEEFFGGDGGGADFADDDAGCVVGEAGGFFERGFAGEGEGEGGDYGVPCPGDVEDFAGGGGDAQELFAFLPEEHPLWTEGDDEVFWGVGFVDSPADIFRGEGFVGLGVEFGELEGFGAVGGKEVEAFVGKGAAGLGVHGEDGPAGAVVRLEGLDE